MSARKQYSFYHKNRDIVLEEMKDINKHNDIISFIVPDYSNGLNVVNIHTNNLKYTQELDLFILLSTIYEANYLLFNIKGSKKQGKEKMRLNLVGGKENITIRSMDLNTLESTTKAYIHVDPGVKEFDRINKMEDLVKDRLKDCYLDFNEKGYYPIVTPFSKFQNVKPADDNNIWRVILSNAVEYEYRVNKDSEERTEENVFAIKLVPDLLKMINRELTSIFM